MVYCFNKEFAYALCQAGFQIARVAPHKTDRNTTVFVFGDDAKETLEKMVDLKRQEKALLNK